MIPLTNVNGIDIHLWMGFDVDLGQKGASPVIVVGGGQSGLAAGRALRELGMLSLILEASERAAGSWPRYYDSLRMFLARDLKFLASETRSGNTRNLPLSDAVRFDNSFVV